MNLHFSRRAAAGLLAFAVVSIALFAFFSARFGGPSLRTGSPFVLQATIADAQGVGPHADVLVRGVKVGQVGDVTAVGGRSRMRLELAGERPVLHRDASIRIGAKTPLGEAFVDLDPGRAAGAALRDGATIAARDAVEVDEALAVLDAPARTDLEAVLATFARGARSPATAQRVSATLDGVDATVTALDGLATTLHGQGADIAGAVQDSRALLRAVADRGDGVRALVRGARATLGAVGAHPAALDAGLRQLPGLLATARTTLGAARPLVAEAQQPVADLRRASAPLAVALRRAPAPLRDVSTVLARAAGLRHAATPALAQLRAVVPTAEPVARILGPVLADVVPILRFVRPRSNTIAAWFTNTADLGTNGDAKGRWARFFVGFDPSTALGMAGGAPQANPYTQPDDAAHNAPYRKGDFQRLAPYGPALEGAGPVR